MKSKKVRPFAHMTQQEKEAELLRLAEIIGRPRALKIIRELQARELAKKHSVN